MGDVLQRLGAQKIRGSVERGRSTCPVHAGESLSIAYQNGFATCHSGCGRSWDALGLVAAVRNLDLHRAADLREAAEELGAILGTRSDVDRPPRHVAPLIPPQRPTRDAGALWGRMASRDEIGEKYLAGRKLLPDVIPSGVLAFNSGSTGDAWLDARASEGYRAAFAVRRAGGSIQTIVLRHCGEAPGEFGKGPALPGCSTRGAAICRPEIALLSTNDPEFTADEIILCEGPTDFLAALIANDVSYGEGRTPPAWPLGIIGVSNAASVIEAFAAVIRGRRFRIWLDSDEAGEAAVPIAAEAAYRAGAVTVTRYRPPSKDVAASFLESEGS